MEPQRNEPTPFGDILRHHSQPWPIFSLHRKACHFLEIICDADFGKLLLSYLKAAYVAPCRIWGNWLLLIVSPTRAIADLLKNVIPEFKRCKFVRSLAEDCFDALKWRRQILIDMNLVYRCISTSILLLACYKPFSNWLIWCPGHNNVKHWLLIWYLLSRANEVFYAFSGDALRIARGDAATSALTKADRIKLALWSYYSLIVDFSILYWVFQNQFENQFRSIIDALYFSAITIATVGYGDFTPVKSFAKMAVVYQVFCGIALLVLSFAIYVGQGPQKESRNQL